MTDTLITYETAEVAKDKGFDIVVGAYYTKYLKTQKSYNPSFRMTKGEIEISHSYFINNGPGDLSTEWYTSYAAPPQSLLKRWLREIHKVHIIVNPTITSHWTFALCNIGNESIDLSGEVVYDSSDYTTYETALEKGLFEALKLI